MSSAEFPGPSFRVCDAATRLAHARREGFRVEPVDECVAVVEAQRFAPSTRWDRPTRRAVHAGRSSEKLSITLCRYRGRPRRREASRTPTSEDGTDRADDAAGRA
jgi:hypothetical protein